MLNRPITEPMLSSKDGVQLPTWRCRWKRSHTHPQSHPVDHTWACTGMVLGAHTGWPSRVFSWDTTRHKSQFAIWLNAHIKVKSLFCFLLKLKFINQDKIKHVRDNAVPSSALYSAVGILISSVKTSFPPKCPIYLVSHAWFFMHSYYTRTFFFFFFLLFFF